MSEQYDHGRCPETGQPFTIYKRSSGKEWGIARRIPESSNYKYLDVNFEWSASEPAVLGLLSKEAAEQRVAEYVQKVLSQCIAPSLTDQDRRRVQFKCPLCGLTHKTQLRADSWDTVKQVVRRTCPKVRRDVLVKVWEMRGKHKVMLSPAGAIDPVPNWDCTECWATGEYVGFSKVEPCSQCFGKPDLKNYKNGSFP